MKNNTDITPYLATIKRAHNFLLLSYNQGELRVKPLLDDVAHMLKDLEANSTYCTRQGEVYNDERTLRITGQ